MKKLQRVPQVIFLLSVKAPARYDVGVLSHFHHKCDLWENGDACPLFYCCDFTAFGL
jgi:hypothetical protein